jgi:hypothetical protein
VGANAPDPQDPPLGRCEDRFYQGITEASQRGMRYHPRSIRQVHPDPFSWAATTAGVNGPHSRPATDLQWLRSGHGTNASGDVPRCRYISG